MEWISPAGRVDFGRRLTLCPRKLLPLKDTVTLLYPMGKAYPNSAPITGLSDPVGGGANSGDDHDAPNSHWQAAFFKIFPTPRFCMDEALVVLSWGVMVPECTLSYAPQSGLKPRPAPCAHTSGPSPGMPGYTGLSSKNQSPEAPSPESGSEESKGVQEL